MAGVVVVVALLSGCSKGSGSSGSAGSSPTPGRSTSSSQTAVASSTTDPVTVGAALVGPELPQRLSRAVAVADSGGVVVLGGLTTAKVSTAEVVRWTPGASADVIGKLDRRVHVAAAAILANRPTVFGGGDGGSVDQVQVVGADGAGTTVGRMPQHRSDLSVAVLDGTAYVLGGFDDNAGTRSVLATIDGRSFDVVADLPGELRYGAAVAASGQILVFGGERASGATDAVLAIDPKAATVTKVAFLPHRLSHASAFAIGGQVYVAGGETDSAKQSDIWRYDVAARTFERAGALPEARSDAAVAVSGATAYLLGGEDPNGAPTSTVIAINRR